ncbi:hypothetical protein SAMN05421788_11598 [Filimonas lacunae]|uniref:MORN repeat variant n=1 Tax=Filimonas lacunae TaxID=477680 RepID=A0A173MC78_9BACT|nr:hypothetical protein [Filimonas lacunae]BAV05061.1 hypothetical protein FLA_1067 [Filimonas lacunae]SIT34294.1 hypothetical protein SAMN05421788_11598 [Filimonas lacunae]
MKWLLFLLVFAPTWAIGQCKVYRIGAKGDTLNCVDKQDHKQGKWVVHVDALRGEPGYEEEGVYRNDKKEGVWRCYNLNGDIIALESYRWGNKDGVSRYFTIQGLLREESWKATNPENPYDTIEVPDPIDPYKVQMKVIKVEGSTVKHGRWQFYDPSSGMVAKTENYFLGTLEDPNKKYLSANTASDSAMQIRKKLSDENKPKEVADFDKKNSGKKKYKVREGRVGY